MIKNVLYIILLTITSLGYSQNIYSESSEFVKNLLASNTDLVVEYKYHCNGAPIIDNCKSESPIYILWTKNNKYYKRKFSKCNIHPIVEIKTSNFLTITQKHIDEINDSKILPVIHKLPINADGYQEIIKLEVSHSCGSTFIFTTKDQTIKKYVNNFELQTEMVDEDIPNDNYEHNQNSILNSLLKLIRKEIE